jgi:hypothetical protein
MSRLLGMRAGSALVVAALAGCASVGPATMPEDRLAYTMAVARSLEEQILLNIVRSRHGEAPTFVDVSQIVAGYEFRREGDLSAEAHFNNRTDSFAGAGVGIGFTEKPTLTYAPLHGEAFARTVVAPIPPHLVLLLLQSGWGAEAVLNMSVSSLNGYRNRMPRMGHSSPADPEFARISKLMRELQELGAVDFNIPEQKEKDADRDRKRTIFLVLRPSSNVSAQAKAQALRKLLGVDDSVNAIPISVGLLAPTDGGITIYTFSLFQMLVYQGKNVDIPDGAGALRIDIQEDASIWQPTMKVHGGKDRPKNAAAAVPYGGHWYWIDRDDGESRVTLMMLTMLYRLLESGTPGNLPVLTIPAG